MYVPWRQYNLLIPSNSDKDPYRRFTKAFDGVVKPWRYWYRRRLHSYPRGLWNDLYGSLSPYPGITL